MTRRRISFDISVALAALLAGAPLAAQSTTNAAAGQATPPASTTPTPAPAPSGSAVGPPQLRDFNLNGTVTQPAETPPPPVIAAPRASPPPARTAAPATRGSSDRPATTAKAATPAPRAPSPAARDRNPSPQAVTIDLPPATAAPIMPEPPAADLVSDAPAVTPALADQSTTNWWPWVAAALAALLAGSFLWWRRQPRDHERYATDHAELGALGTAPQAPPAPLPRASAPQGQAPRPASPTSPARPQSFRPAPAPAPQPPTPTPTPAPAPTAPAAPAPIAGGIVASGLKPRIEFELVPLRAETDEAEGAALTFDMIVINRGSAPARDVLIEAQLINAGPQVDAEVARFFLSTPQGGNAVPMIGPMSRAAISMRLTVPGAAIAPLVVEGRKLLVPIIAINAVYRWSGGELKDSASFIVGRGDSEAEKLAPFRLDLGARSWSGLSARLHSNGLQA